MKQKLVLGVGGLIGIVVLASTYLRGHSIAVLQPRGQIASQERDLIFLAALLSILVVVPVFIMLFLFAWRYRENAHPKTKYQPNWDHHGGLETTWWLVPTAIILILSVATWQSSHTLDPFRPIASTTKSIDVEVVALQWKWLFIYPEQRVATVNTLYMPVGTPVNFHITSDAPMNSFWIPSLGGQMYAMAGMSTQLHLQADEAGTYRGSSANISGDGFADMHFAVNAVSQLDFRTKLEQLSHSNQKLDFHTYQQLARPSTIKQAVSYRVVDPGLYDDIIMKYMSPMEGAMPAGHNHGASL